MEKKYKINWKRGLEVTPEVMITSDNYHETRQNMLSAMLAARFYGLIPEGKFYIEKEISNNRLIVKSLNCSAITSEGVLISIPKERNFRRELSLSEVQGSEVYIVLTINPFSLAQTDETDTYIYPDCNLVVKKTTEPIEFGIPLLKLKNLDSSWALDNDYIPPSAALNAADLLLQKYHRIATILRKIIAKNPVKNTLYVPYCMLKFEFNDFTSTKSPEEFSIVMKKFIWLFYSQLVNDSKLSESLEMKSFIDEPFNHNEIGKIFQLGLECFEEVFSFYDVKSEIEELEI
jgi:predicted component of type VI protein secretion system